MSINRQILDIVANTSRGDAASLVTQWCNASEVEISDEGNIWIANPQRGHWLSAEKTAEFLAWCGTQND